MTYGKVARTGPAAKIEALLVREYLRQRQALPQRQRGGGNMRGGYTDIFVTGVLGPIVYADVESLYPSIMLNYDVKPQSDRLGLFQRLLHSLTELRLDTKRCMEAAVTPDERGALDAQQSSYKILINSFYGQLGFSRALFNDFAEADRVAATGQEILKQIMAAIRREDGTVIEVDTDGVFFVPPSALQGEAAERNFVAQLNREMPPGIRIGYDGRFQKMLSYKSKNYALMAYDGKMKFKGSSLVSRAIERFGPPVRRSRYRAAGTRGYSGPARPLPYGLRSHCEPRLARRRLRPHRNVKGPRGALSAPCGRGPPLQSRVLRTSARPRP